MFVERYCSKSVFDVARVLAALWVFLCHSFYPVHYWFGFYSVFIFFFISGYGMEVTSSRMRALSRLPRFIAVYVFFMLFYYVYYGSTFFPTNWFLQAYFVVMLLYRFLGHRPFFFTFFFNLVMLYYIQLDYFLQYYMCSVGFLVGYWVARRKKFLTWFDSFLFLPLFMLSFPSHSIVPSLFLFPLILHVFLYVASLPSISFLSRYAYLTFPFFSLHCWFLGIFDATWTLQRGQSFYGAILAFLCSLSGAWLLWRFVPIFSKKKFLIFQ